MCMPIGGRKWPGDRKMNLLYNLCNVKMRGGRPERRAGPRTV